MKLEKATNEAIEGWSGWEWTHDPGHCSCDLDAGGIIAEGPGAIEDWDAWEAERVGELSDHSDECAADIAAAERAYGEECLSAARGAADEARDALSYAEDGEWACAIKCVRSAMSSESDYGDSPTYSELLEAFETAAHEASRELAEEGLIIRRGASAVIVNDGQDIWACSREAWDACERHWDLVLDMGDDEEDEDASWDAYQTLCDECPAQLTQPGATGADAVELARAIVDDGLMDADEVMSRWGVEAEAP